MIIQMKPEVKKEDIGKAESRLKELAQEADVGVHYRLVWGEEQPVIAVKGSGADIAQLSKERLEQLEAVQRVIPVAESYKLASRSYMDSTRTLDVAGRQVGNGELCVMAGPCAVESREQILQAAQDAKAAGADMLRGGAYKPRTSPYSFHGLQEEGLKLLREAKEETGLPIVTEITDQRNIDMYLEAGVDVFQVGARNSQNYDLLGALASGLSGTDAAVLYKRGPATSLDEFIQGAEYLLSGDVQNVMLCLRGIKGTDDTYTRNSVDTGDVSVLTQRCNLPVIYDPSHAAGHRDLIYGTALGAVGHGAHGLLVEAHPQPENALSDGKQSLYTNAAPDSTEGLSRVISDSRELYAMRRNITER